MTVHYVCAKIDIMKFLYPLTAFRQRIFLCVNIAAECTERILRHFYSKEVNITGKTNKLRYRTADEMSAAIEKYFEDCNGHVLTDKDGNTVYSKSGEPVIVGVRPPTVTGLALALGFKTRQSLLNYQARSAAFNDIITVAKSRCEEYAESRLYDRDGVNGAKFSLMNNFKGWREKPAEDNAEALSKLDEVLSKIGGDG